MTKQASRVKMKKQTGQIARIDGCRCHRAVRFQKLRAAFFLALLFFTASTIVSARAQQSLETDESTAAARAQKEAADTKARVAREKRADEDHRMTIEMLQWMKQQKEALESGQSVPPQASQPPVQIINSMPGTASSQSPYPANVLPDTNGAAPSNTITTTTTAVAPAPAVPAPLGGTPPPSASTDARGAAVLGEPEKKTEEHGHVPLTAVMIALLLGTTLYVFWQSRTNAKETDAAVKTVVRADTVVSAQKEEKAKPQIELKATKKAASGLTNIFRRTITKESKAGGAFSPFARLNKLKPPAAIVEDLVGDLVVGHITPPRIPVPQTPFDNERTAGIAELEQFFENPFAPVRAGAASALGRVRNTAAVPVLLRGIKDEDADVRAAVAASLVVYQNVYQFPAGTTANIKSVMNNAQAVTETARPQSAATNIRSWPKSNLPQAAPKPASFPIEKTREQHSLNDDAEQSFKIVGGENAHVDAPSISAARPSATVMVKNNDGDFEDVPNPALSIEALPVEPPTEARTIHAALTQLSSGDTPNARREGASILGQHAYAVVVDALVIAALHDEDESVRAAAVSSLGEINHISTYSTISIALGDDAPPVKAAAARARSNMRYSRIEAYENCMQEASDNTLKQMTAALLKTGFAAQAMENLASTHPEQVKEAEAVIKLIAKGGEIKLLEETSRHHAVETVREAAASILRAVA